MLKRLKRNLQNLDYYFGQLVGFIPVSFIIVFWIYILGTSRTNLDAGKLILYFLYMAPLNFLVFFSLSDEIVDLFKNHFDEVLLSPEPAMRTILRRYLTPHLVDGFPFFVILVLITYFLSYLNIYTVILMFGLIIFGLIQYVFMCLVAAIVALYFEIDDWIAFFLRFTGVFWSGAYIPIVILTGGFLALARLLPFAFLGTGLQVILTPQIDLWLVINMTVYALLGVFLSRILFKKYKVYFQT